VSTKPLKTIKKRGGIFLQQGYSTNPDSSVVRKILKGRSASDFDDFGAKFNVILVEARSKQSSKNKESATELIRLGETKTIIKPHHRESEEMLAQVLASQANHNTGSSPLNYDQSPQTGYDVDVANIILEQQKKNKSSCCK